MRNFNNINELWNYCSYCPICKLSGRDLSATIISPSLKSLSWTKDNDKLSIVCETLCDIDTDDILKNQINVEIDCANNKILFDKVLFDTDTFLYLVARCKCDMSNISSTNMFFELGEIVSPIGIEQESVFFMNDKENFHLSVFHTSENILFSKLIKNEFFENSFINDTIITAPIFHMDLDDSEKCISKLKTIMVFG